ncbi:MAG: TM1812 family CRISPR-associated protein [Desulfurococcales archaeon]|nr:TM1812 family CRISPR-associated protein [Desulfurococcales archaeon]
MSYVLVATLGAGIWREVTYLLYDRATQDNYATSALIKLLKELGIDIGQVVLIGTKGSSWELALNKLRNMKVSITRIVVPEGRSADELKELYYTILSELMELKDLKVIVDLTHAFRHHSLILLQILTLLDQLGYIDLYAVYYALLPVGSQKATFINLVEAIKLESLALNALTFKLSYRILGLNYVIEHINKLRAIAHRMSDKRRSEVYGKLSALLSALRNIGTLLNANHVYGFVNKIDEVLRRLREYKDLSRKEIPTVYPIVASIEDTLRKFRESTQKRPLWEVQIRLAEMYLNAGRYVSAACLLREGLLTYACHKISMNCKQTCVNSARCINRELREYVSQTLSRIAQKRIKYPNEKIVQVAQLYDRVINQRNKIVHAFVCSEEEGIPELQRSLRELCSKITKLIAKENITRL